MPKKSETEEHLDKFKALTRQLIAAPKEQVDQKEKAFHKRRAVKKAKPEEP